MSTAGKKVVSIDEANPALALFKEDIAKSGISLIDARRAGVKLAGPDELWKLLRPKNPERAADFTVTGEVFPYFTPLAERLPFVRVRRLDGRWTKDDDGSQRYAQPPNSLPHLYLPAPVCDWLPKKPGEKIRVPRLIITEGEKKALKANLVGIPAVAIGGVTAYRSARYFVLLLEEFGWFDLSATDVEIVFDSDSNTNPDVNTAALSVAGTLRRDANPRSIRHVRLTSENTGGKVGLDEFLAAYPKAEDARRAYDRLERKDDPLSEAFAVFNRDLVHVRKKTRYYNVATDTWYESQKKVVEEYARGTPIIGSTGKELYPIARWFTDRPETTTVLDVVYAPGYPPRFRPTDAVGEVLNNWRPSPIDHAAYKHVADVAEFIEFVEYLTPTLTPAERSWFLDWSAYPLQNVGRKVMSAVLIWSPQTGTGKNTYGRILKRCYGDSNTYEMDGASLADRFNNWALHQLVIINEVDQPSYNERAAVMARLKTIITEERIDLDRKYLPRENVPNYVNVYLTSNKHNALSLDEKDRRFFVIEAPERKWSPKKFKTFNAWLEASGYEKVCGYFLSRNLADFDPYAPPPKTEAWREMVAGTATSPIDEVVETLVTRPAAVLGSVVLGMRTPPLELWLPDQLVEAVRAYAKKENFRVNVTVGTLRSALGKRKVVKRVMEVKRGSVRRTVTAYAMFNDGRWRDAPTAAWRGYILTENEDLCK